MSEIVEMGRDKLFTMRMSEEESARLETVARHYGLNAAGVLRMLLKQEADTIDAERAMREASLDLPKLGSYGDSRSVDILQALKKANGPVRDVRAALEAVGFGPPDAKELRSALAKLVKLGFVERSKAGVTITPKGRLIA